MTCLDQEYSNISMSAYDGSELRPKKGVARRITQVALTSTVKAPITMRIIAQLGSALDALSLYDTFVELFVEFIVYGVGPEPRRVICVALTRGLS